MVLNEILTKQNFITKILLTDGESELPKELKVKIIKIRIAYNKIKKQFDEELQECREAVVTEEIKELSNKENRTEEETAKLTSLIDNANAEINEFVNQKGIEEVSLTIDDSFNDEEFENILEVNSNNDVEINSTKVSAPEFMEIFYALFVK